MKLASLKSKSKDGELLIVSRDNQKAIRASHIAPSFREAIENWREVKPKLEELYQELNAGKAKGSFPLDEKALHSPLPRAFQWLDGSAFLQHVKLVRQARGAEMPPEFLRVPLMYQGGSDGFLAPYEDIPQIDPAHGTDFEGEVAVITDFIPMGSSPQEAEKKILFFVLVNDVSLRGLIPEEIKNGFGFLHGKPSSSFSPLALSVDELAGAWREGRVNLPLLVEMNGRFFGKANAGAMHFSFGELLAHAARTRDLQAGTILGSGTVSNEDTEVGSSCLAEKRMLEVVQNGKATTDFLRVGDTVRIEMRNEKGENLFGTIYQKVVKSTAADRKFVRD